MRGQRWQPGERVLSGRVRTPEFLLRLKAQHELYRGAKILLRASRHLSNRIATWDPAIGRGPEDLVHPSSCEARAALDLLEMAGELRAQAFEMNPR